MSTTAKALSDQAVLLPPEERLALGDRLLDTLDEPGRAMVRKSGVGELVVQLFML